MIPRRLDTKDDILFYENEFYVFSNFSSFRLVWKGIDFDTSEHAYQWEKFQGHPTLQSQIETSRSAHSAYFTAQHNSRFVREDWADVKVATMKAILLEKVRQHEYVRRKLIDTRGRRLIEDSWRDSFWGWGEEKNGRNMLGTLWMEVRDEYMQSLAG